MLLDQSLSEEKAKYQVKAVDRGYSVKSVVEGVVGHECFIPRPNFKD